MRKIKPNAKEISKEKLAELKANAKGILADHRRTLFNDFPFCGSVIMSLDIVPTRDARLATAACDGRHIFFDIDFLSSLTPDFVKFVLAHEVFHALMAHFMRGNGYDDHSRANIAMDLEVNQLLTREGLSCPPDGCMPKKFHVPEGLSFEEYYKLLGDKPQQSIMQQMMQGNSDTNVDGDTSNDPNSSGNSNSSVKGQFDKHLSPSDNVAQLKPDESLCDKWGKLGFDPDYSPALSDAEVKESAEHMREAAISAAQNYEKQRGTLPGHLAQFVDKLTKPEVPWQEVLASFVTRVVGSDPDWNRPNRRFVHSRLYLPSHTSESVKLGVIIDTSGSTATDIPKFLGEVNGIVRAFSGYSLTIVQVDTTVNSVETYSDDNPLDLEHSKFNVRGGGGTEIYPGFKYFLENPDDVEVDALVCFTDGYTEDFSEDMDPGIPTLWVVTKDGNTKNIHFGEICQFKNNSSEA